MQFVPDRRVWLETDRPHERIALGAPLENVTLLSARDSDRCWRECHSTFKICLISRSSATSAATYRCRGEHTVVEGDLMAFEPGEHHVTTRVRGRASFELIAFEPAELHRAACELGLKGAVHFKAAKLRSDAVALAIQRFVACASRGEDRLQLECLYTGLLRAVLGCCAETPLVRTGPRRIPHAGVRRVRDLLREHFVAPPTLGELAARVGLSRFGLAHAFTQCMGLPPHVYSRLRRLAEARRRIEQGAPIDEVARMVGYGDVTAFTRAFKASFGASPARWRRAFQVNTGLPLPAENTPRSLEHSSRLR